MHSCVGERERERKGYVSSANFNLGDDDTPNIRHPHAYRAFTQARSPITLGRPPPPPSLTSWPAADLLLLSAFRRAAAVMCDQGLGWLGSNSPAERSPAARLQISVDRLDRDMPFFCTRDGDAFRGE